MENHRKQCNYFMINKISSKIHLISAHPIGERKTGEFWFKNSLKFGARNFIISS